MKKIIFKKVASLLSLVILAAALGAMSPAMLSAAQCGPQNAGLPGCQPAAGGAAAGGAAGGGDLPANNPIVKDINMFVNFLAGLVGIVVVGSIILGGVQYTMAGDNPQAVSAAKKRITDGLIALVAFAFTYAFLQWLVPGGIF